MRRLLLSLCSRVEHSLVLYDSATDAVEPIDLQDPGVGAFGVCAHRNALYCVIDQGRPTPSESELSELIALDPHTFSPRWRYSLRVGRDVHSLAACADCLYAVSTGKMNCFVSALTGTVSKARRSCGVRRTHARVWSASISDPWRWSMGNSS